MTDFSFAFFAFAILLVFYFCIALFLCNELNRDYFHWWCPMCQIVKRFGRRMEP